MGKKVLCSGFRSEKVESSEFVCLGKHAKGIHLKKYKIACFISGFDLAFKHNGDHHLKRIEMSCELADDKLSKKDGSIYAQINLKSFLTNNGKNHFDIPHNSVSGFVVAFKNDVDD